MTTSGTQTTADESATGGAGKLLRAAREARGMTALQVAGKLRLDVKHIEAMERDEFTTLVAPVFARGYLRSYAQFLELSPDTFVKSYENQKGPMPMVLHGRSVLSGEDSDVSDRSISWIIYIIILASLILGVVWWQTQGTFKFGEDQPVANFDSESPPDPQEVVEPMADTSPPATSPPTGLASVSPVSAGAPAVTLPPKQIATIAQPADVPAQPQPSAAPSVTQPHEISATVAAPSVVINLTAESWVDITDADGNRLVYKMLPAGTSKTLNDLKLPLKVVLGNAAGVKLEYNGQPFDHSRYSRNGVTRFELGSPNLSAAQHKIHNN
ncbi:MAG: RodZ domain-containing protein [Gammaproteobacteria bacterium]